MTNTTHEYVYVHTYTCTTNIHLIHSYILIQIRRRRLAGDPGPQPAQGGRGADHEREDQAAVRDLTWPGRATLSWYVTYIL